MRNPKCTCEECRSLIRIRDERIATLQHEHNVLRGTVSGYKVLITQLKMALVGRYSSGKNIPPEPFASGGCDQLYCECESFIVNDRRQNVCLCCGRDHSINKKSTYYT